MSAGRNSGVSKSGAARSLVLHKAGGKLANPVSITVRAKTFDTVARQRGSAKALIDTFGDALDRSLRTGETVTFEVAVRPRGRPTITRGAGAPKPDATGDLARALEAARARGRLRAAEILSGDDMLSADRFAALIGTSRVTVNSKRRNNRVLGLDGAKRGYRFPAWQIDRDGKPFDAIPGLFERLGGGAWTIYRFLMQHHPELDGLTGLEALQHDKTGQVLDLAEGVARGTFA